MYNNMNIEPGKLFKECECHVAKTLLNRSLPQFSHI
jgi:hypothetical protein